MENYFPTKWKTVIPQDIQGGTTTNQEETKSPKHKTFLQELFPHELLPPFSIDQGIDTLNELELTQTQPNTYSLKRLILSSKKYRKLKTYMPQSIQQVLKLILANGPASVPEMFESPFQLTLQLHITNQMLGLGICYNCFFKQSARIPYKVLGKILTSPSHRGTHQTYVHEYLYQGKQALMHQRLSADRKEELPMYPQYCFVCLDEIDDNENQEIAKRCEANLAKDDQRLDQLLTNQELTQLRENKKEYQKTLQYYGVELSLKGIHPRATITAHKFVINQEYLPKIKDIIVKKEGISRPMSKSPPKGEDK